MKEALLAQLRASLEETGRTKQLEKQANNADNLNKTLNTVPMGFYIF
jgi:hypothetical protein